MEPLSAQPDPPLPNPGPPDLGSAVAAMMNSAWRSPGYCVPNPHTYPHQWLWDSCFHALIWLRLDDHERARRELHTALGATTVQGFVPHMIYHADPTASRDLWGRTGTSVITQPPMYGHVAAELVRAGVDVDTATARRALLHLLDDRTRTPSGLVPVFHPWETGCDDSPRWDDWRRHDRTIEAWREAKVGMVRSLRLVDGVPVANPDFTVGSIGFNALVAWNARELCTVDPDDRLRERADALADVIAGRWSAQHRTWIDEAMPTDAAPRHEAADNADTSSATVRTADTSSATVRTADTSSATVRTADALLGLLVDPRVEALAELADPAAFAAPFGPRGVAADEPTYDPSTYWRGPAWPQLAYLLSRAAGGSGDDTLRRSVERCLVAGAGRSGLAEYWNPDSGEGLGARPQTWAGLALVVG